MSRNNHTISMQELLALPQHELMGQAQAQRQELQRMRFAHASGRLQKTHTLRTMRRRLARILTAHSQVSAQSARTPT